MPASVRKAMLNHYLVTLVKDPAPAANHRGDGRPGEPGGASGRGRCPHRFMESSPLQESMDLGWLLGLRFKLVLALSRRPGVVGERLQADATTSAAEVGVAHVATSPRHNSCLVAPGAGRRLTAER